MTTQSPHLYSRQTRQAQTRQARQVRQAGPARTVSAAPAGSEGGTSSAPPAGVQTRLPWWAVALPAVAFAALLALLSGGSAQADTAASGADLLGRMVTVLTDLVHHLP
ncbi:MULTISPECIES: hypothetical protein [unclassified Streptomyces]|uniref:hypothetical protein n=1 Tax=unclassified Streptomyces TaxID=2593676 RepID=UPI002E2D2A04|nr:hypothetical protein [Streptomyces sp. NBC_00223]